MENRTNILLAIFFETGDSSCKYWEEYVFLHKSISENIIENVIRETMNDDRFEDMDYTQIVHIALSKIDNLQFSYCRFPLDNITSIINIFID